MKSKIFYSLLLSLLFVFSSFAQDASEIIRKADQKLRGESSYAHMEMSIIRPSWQRDVSMESWSKGEDLALIHITAPAREKGTGFLKRGKEMWNWQPTIERTIKMPPSMMGQSWMGSDFTNDDLVKQSSMVVDYTHKISGEETLEGRETYKINMIPKPDAPVVWGKVITWISKEDYIQLKSEFYNEDEELINTMYGREIVEFDGKWLPSVIEMIPAEEPDQKTVIRYIKLKFDTNPPDDFFSVRNLRQLK